MPYAHNGTISQDPIDGGIEITQEQYQEALRGMSQGLVVTIDGGFNVGPPPAPEPEPTPEPEPITTLAPRDYLKRFTFDEYAAVRAGSVEVQYSLDNLIAAQYVDLNDPEVAQGLDLMVAEGIISAERKEQLLEPL